ncbi:MAG: hypothetical protein PF904_15600 [Kiritimatiellae bacterium]|jgi:putative transposase|nr:hypothetical protein [Kiritimatiellia bacterium]
MFEPKKSLSQKLRMEGRDYSRPGWCFVSMCADYHKYLFGAVRGVEMVPNALGAMVERCWAEIPEHYGNIVLGAWQLMPNHFHGLVRIVHAGGAGLGEVLNMFKGSVTRLARKEGLVVAGSRHGENEQARVWAPNYWDVICFEPEQLEVREKYIRANPRRWALKDVAHGRIKRSLFKGNVKLLQTATRRALRVSRKASEAEIEVLKAELTGFDGVVCSTFFSPGERACLDTLLMESAKIVWVLPMALPEKIPVAWTDTFLAGRALWLSAFEELEATRANCRKANEWVEDFCVDFSRHGEHELLREQNEQL